MRRLSIRHIRRWIFLVPLAILASSPLSQAAEPVPQAPEAYGRFQFDEASRNHWSFLPVVRPEIPAVQHADSVATPVDAFILAELEAAGLAPAAPADRVTLLRRVYLDLTGMPPTPAEQAAWLSDERPDAYERLVENLLGRPAYGERWGRHWLDVVRYAESNGYERDNAKPNVWRYRDYVIDAFNADKPYDRFVLEQIAGDELDDANAESHIATTFLRLGLWDDEPADPEVDRYDQLDDLVGATASTFMAQSLRCARCHDHKFEQFTQRDYTRVLAVFEPLKRPQDGRTDLDRPVGTTEEVAAYDRQTKEVDAKVAAIKLEAAVAEHDLCKRLASDGLLREPQQPKTIVADARGGAQAWRFTTDAPAEGWMAPTFDDASWRESPGGFGNPDTPGTTGPDGSLVRTRWEGERIWLRRPFELTADGLAELRKGRVRISIHHDDEAQVYINGALAIELKGFTVAYEDKDLSDAAIATFQEGRNVIAVACHQTTGGQYIDVGVSLAPPRAAANGIEFPADALAAIMTAPADRNDGQRELVKKHRDVLHKGLVKLDRQAELDQLLAFDKRAAALDETRPAELPRAYIWYEDAAHAGPSRVFKRGDPRAPQEEVASGMPAILIDAAPPPPTPRERSTGRRRQLAEWLVRPDHPLTARVMVNRIWQHHFGEGLVSTENDFGVMGDAPTHPKLLDWLAAEFTARHWSIKELHRLIVLSNTYRQSAQASEGSLARDPRGGLYSRWMPRRLEAEAVRDAVLAASGQLNPKRGGPSVYPKISDAVLAGQSRPGLGWTVSDPVEAARRTVYVFVKRTLLVPELEVMDFPDTNGSCEQRTVSTVAPQALTYLNGEFMQQQAGRFAQRLLSEAADESERIRRGFAWTVSRPPTENELAAVQRFLAEQRRQIAADGPPGLPADQIEQRVWTGLCLVLLNSNEFVYLN